METFIPTTKIIFEPWDPKYIIIPQMKRAKDIVKSEDWNSLFNRLITQGDWNSEALDKLINGGTLKVKNAEHADDSDNLEGQPASYFANRDNVIGKDEDVYSPGNLYTPTHKKHPVNKNYVDEVAKNIGEHSPEFDNIVYFDNVDTGPQGPITIDQALRDGIGEVIHNKYMVKSDITQMKDEIIQELMPQGGGDMVKAMYDANGNGVVDDAEALGGFKAAEYGKVYTRELGTRKSIGTIEFLITD